MNLLPKGLRDSLPALGSTDGADLRTRDVAVKFFDPCGSWTWYAFEGAPEPSELADDDVLFFGLVVGHEKELGYWTLAQLREVKGPLGLGIERDIHFSGPVPERDQPASW